MTRILHRAVPHNVVWTTQRLKAGRIVLVAVAILGWACPVRSAGDGGDVRRYDIPSQKLEQALSRLAEESGVDILLNDSVASGRRSSAVAGRLSRPEALSRMLNGTGLTMRFTSPRSAVVYVIGQPPQQHEAAARWSAPATLALDMMRVTAPRLIGSPARPRYRDYTVGLARDIQRKLVDAKVLVSGTPVVTRIGTRIDADGTLREVEIVTPGNDRTRAQRLVRLLEGQRVADRPPADLPQPLIFDVRSR